MTEWCNRCKVQIWSYCLMPNYVYLIAGPESEDGLYRAIGEAHRRYTRYINFQKEWWAIPGTPYLIIDSLQTIRLLDFHNNKTSKGLLHR